MEEGQDRLEAIRRSLNILCIIAVFVICYFARDLLFPVILGFLLALTLSPVTRALAGVGIPYGVSAFTLIGSLATGIVLLIFFSAGIVTNWADDIRLAGAELERELSGLIRQVESVKEMSDDMTEIADGGGTEDVQEVVVRQPTLVDSAISVMGQVGALLVVSFALAIFLLASGDLFYVKLVQSFRTMREKKRALTMVYDVERRVSRYLLTITLINAGLGVAVGLAMWAIGLNFPYIFGVAAFALNFLPYLGAMVGAALVAIYAVVALDPLSYAIVAPLTYYALTAIEGQFITPWLVGRRLELNAVAVFLTVVIWAWLWGIPGALIAVPVLVVFKVICENVDRLSVVSNFLGGAGSDTATVPPPEDVPAE